MIITPSHSVYYETLWYKTLANQWKYIGENIGENIAMYCSYLINDAKMITWCVLVLLQHL